MTTTHDVQQQLLAYLRANVAEAGPLEVTTDLLGLGVLDSLLVADLFVFLESRLGVTLTAGDVSPQNFRSVERLAAFVVAKQQKVAKAA
jgi:betaine-aldehyde dehydrogenase